MSSCLLHLSQNRLTYKIYAYAMLFVIPLACETEPAQKTNELDEILDLAQFDQDIPKDALVAMDQALVQDPQLPPCENGAKVYCEHATSQLETLSSETLNRCVLPRRTCINQQWSDCVYPVERCDGLDNDCDGQSDEGYALGDSCEAGVGECRQAGVRECSSQGLVTCSAKASDPQVERCDSLDNDCDGRSDEDFENLGAACQVGTGACLQEGVMVCDQLRTQTLCSASPLTPQLESCDQIDNDCDYRIDEQLPEDGQSCFLAEFDDGFQGLEGACAVGIQSCQEGTWVCEVETEAQAEVCDGLDNDCDGLADEDGPSLNTVCETQFRGVCRLGVWACSPAQTWSCEALNEPVIEFCDREDNDCDGEIDESDPQVGQSCTTEQLGACVAGRWVCDQGALLCEALRDSSTEICDGEDNDCDGIIDEAIVFERTLCDTRERGLCQEGHPRCQDGALICQRNAEPSVELCDDLDNDCDGRSDEDFPALGSACAVGQGACLRQGIMGCDLNNEGAICLARPAQPETERCDQIDNDCDGLIDNTEYPPSETEHCGACGISCPDTPSQRATCYGAVCGLAQCQAGLSDINQDPSDGCEATCVPSALNTELCDAVDNDCDGFVDESERCRFGEVFDYCVNRQDLGLQDEVCDTLNTFIDQQEWWPSTSEHHLFPSSKTLIKQDVIGLGVNATQEYGALQRRLPPRAAAFEVTLGIRPPSVLAEQGKAIAYESPESQVSARLSFTLESRPKYEQLTETDQWIGLEDEASFSEEEKVQRTEQRRLLSLWIEWIQGAALISIKQGTEQQLIWQAAAPQIDLHQVRSGELVALNWSRTTQAQHSVQVDGVYLQPHLSEEVNQSKTYNIGMIWLDQVDISDSLQQSLTPFPSIYSPEVSHVSLRFDEDGDGYYPPFDNCLHEYNPEQLDADQNGRGLACDDPDQDGHESGLDNCPRIYNPSQDDFDANGQGDACEGDGELIVMSDRAGVVQPWRYRLGYGWVKPLSIPMATNGKQISVNARGDIAYIYNGELFLKRNRGDEVSFGEGFAEVLFIGTALYSIDQEQRILRRHEVVEEANDLIPALIQSYETAIGFQVSFAGGLNAEGLNERIFLWEFGQSLGSNDQGVWLIEINRSGTVDYSIGPIFEDPSTALPSLSIHPSLPKALLASENGIYTGVWSLDLSTAHLQELSSVPTKEVLWWAQGGTVLSLRSGQHAFELALAEAQAQRQESDGAWTEQDAQALNQRLFGQGAHRAPQEKAYRGVLSIHQDINRFEESRLEMLNSGDHLLALSLVTTPSRSNFSDDDGDGLPDAFDYCSAEDARDDLRFIEYPWIPQNSHSVKLTPHIDGNFIDWISATKQRFMSSADQQGQELTRLNYNNIGRINCYHTPYSEGYHAWLTWTEGAYWLAYVDCFTDESNFQLHWLSDHGQYDPPWRNPVDTSQVITREVSSNNNTHFHWNGEVMRVLFSDYQFRYIWNFDVNGNMLSVVNSGNDLNNGHAYFNEELGVWRDLGIDGRYSTKIWTVQTNGYTSGSQQISPRNVSKRSGMYGASPQIFHGSGLEYSVHIDDEAQILGYLVREDGYPSFEGVTLLNTLEEIYRLYSTSGINRHALLVYGRDQQGDGLFALTFDHRLQNKSPLIRLSSLGAQLIQKPRIHQVGRRWQASWFEAERGLVSVSGALECAQ